MSPIPTHCSQCNGLLIKATAADKASMEKARKRLRTLRMTPMQWLSAYICQDCGRIYVFAQERDI